LKDDFVVGFAGNFARESFDMFGDRGDGMQAGSKSMLVGVLPGTLFAGAGGRTGAFTGIAPIGRDLPFGGHGLRWFLTGRISELKERPCENPV
jgi:hypothetical protein